MSNMGQPLICDFGLARIATESMSLSMNTTSPRGTPRFLAPEFFALKDSVQVSVHSKETDVWAFGATVYVSVSPQFLC